MTKTNAEKCDNFCFVNTNRKTRTSSVRWLVEGGGTSAKLVYYDFHLIARAAEIYEQR